ncbi:MAG: Aspartate carbamoyltransferase, partial [uncultured Sphingomonadaceae bacterium]
ARRRAPPPARHRRPSTAPDHAHPGRSGALGGRARRSGGAAARGADADQRLFRAVHPHAAVVRDRRQAIGRGCSQYARGRVQRDQGRNADRHGRHPERDARGRAGDPPRVVGRGGADRRQGGLPRAQRGRRIARAPHPGAARRAHHPAAERGAGRPARGDLRRPAAQPGGALQHPAAHRHGRRGARRCARHPAARGVEGDGRRGLHGHGRGDRGRGRRHDAARPARAHGGRPYPLPARIPRLLGPDPRALGARRAGRACDAPGADEPGRGDCEQRGGRSRAVCNHRAGGDGRRGADGVPRSPHPRPAGGRRVV